MSDNPQNPLTDPPPSEVPLPDAPLERVVAQLRFEPILSIGDESYIASFQEVLRDRYPVLKEDQIQTFRVSEGEVEAKGRTTWRFVDDEKDYTVSLTADFVALETKAYTSRKDFIARFDGVLQALASEICPGRWNRIGLRYVDRIRAPQLERIDALIRNEMLGISTTALGDCARQIVTESIFEVEANDAHLKARWGSIPAGSTVNRQMLAPINEPSWLLDLDMFRVDDWGPFDPDEMTDVVRGFAERLYTFFRWVVTDDFLREYGGQP